MRTIILVLILCSVVYGDRVIFQYRDKGVEIIVKLIDEPNEPNEPPVNEMKWISPVTYEDPNNGWAGEARIIDGDTTTYAVASAKDVPLVLSIEPSDSNACRLFMRSVSRFWRIDVFSGEWEKVFDGGINYGWFEIHYPLRKVSKARIFQTGGSSNGSISEFEFFASEPNEPNEPVVIEPNEPVVVSGPTMGDYLKYWREKELDLKDNNFNWYVDRCEKGLNDPNDAPWYIREKVIEYFNG